MRFRNESDNVVTAAALGVHQLPPGGECEIREEYSRPRRAGNGSRVPSAVEMLAPQLLPADEDERVVWRNVPDEDRPTPRAKNLPTVASLVALGVPPAVAEATVAAMETSRAPQPPAADARGKKGRG